MEIASVDRHIIFETNDVGKTFLETMDGKRTFFELFEEVAQKYQWYQDLLNAGKQGKLIDSFHEKLLQLYQAKYDFLSFLVTLWRMKAVGLKCVSLPGESELLNCREVLLRHKDQIITYQNLVIDKAAAAEDSLAFNSLLADLTIEIEFLLQKGHLVPVRSQ